MRSITRHIGPASPDRSGVFPVLQCLGSLRLGSSGQTRWRRTGLRLPSQPGHGDQNQEHLLTQEPETGQVSRCASCRKSTFQGIEYCRIRFVINPPEKQIQLNLRSGEPLPDHTISPVG